MPIPPLNDFLVPFLTILGDGQRHTRAQMLYALAQRLGISEEKAQQMSGNQFTLVNRVAWCDTHLVRAGFVEKRADRADSMQDSFSIAPLGMRDLVGLPALFADLDDPETALARLAWCDLPASCIVHSGRGYHAYWFLDAPTVDIPTAEWAMRGLAERLGGDGAISAAHSMRLPGTANTKPGRGGAPCAIVRYCPERRYPLAAFAAFRPAVRWQPPPALRRRWVDATPDPATLAALTAAVMAHLEGRPRGGGFIGARCPLPHAIDRPGSHFSYDPASGWGRCFGRHGRFSPASLCDLLGVTAARPRPAPSPDRPPPRRRHAILPQPAGVAAQATAPIFVFGAEINILAGTTA